MNVRTAFEVKEAIHIRYRDMFPYAFLWKPIYVYTEDEYGSGEPTLTKYGVIQRVIGKTGDLHWVVEDTHKDVWILGKNAWISEEDAIGYTNAYFIGT